MRAAPRHRLGERGSPSASSRTTALRSVDGHCIEAAAHFGPAPRVRVTSRDRGPGARCDEARFGEGSAVGSARVRGRSSDPRRPTHGDRRSRTRGSPHLGCVPEVGSAGHRPQRGSRRGAALRQWHSAGAPDLHRRGVVRTSVPGGELNPRHRGQVVVDHACTPSWLGMMTIPSPTDGVAKLTCASASRWNSTRPVVGDNPKS